MTLTIDNLGGAGPRDYTAALDRDAPFVVHRSLNAASSLQFSLVAHDPALVLPGDGARVRLLRRDGTALFDGVVAGEPEFESLGWGERGPVYRLQVTASSDEYLLDQQALPAARLFNDVSAGDVLAQLTRDATGAEPDGSAIQPLETVFGFDVPWRTPWSAHAAALAQRTRAVYRWSDGRLALEPLAARTHALSEAAPDFSPDALTLRMSPPAAIDVTVIGPPEPAAYVSDYFLADGLTADFSLSRAPFSSSGRTVLEEAFSGLAPDPARWDLAGPPGSLTCADGALVVNGGTGVDGETTAVLIGKLDLGGAAVLLHGTVTLLGACSGVIGGLYRGSIAQPDCLAGFLFETTGTETTICALVDGVARDPRVTAQAGHAYMLRTRLFCREHTRADQAFHSSLHPAGAPIGGSPHLAPVRVVLEYSDVDLAGPAPQPLWTALYDDVLPAAPACARYAIVNAASMHATVALPSLLQAPQPEVRCARPAEEFRTIALGRRVDGNAAVMTPGASLHFYAETAPQLQERVVVRYRSRARAAARVRQEGSARAVVCSVIAPPPATSQDCRYAALAILEDVVQPGLAGEYLAWSDFVDDVLPGDALLLDLPSRGVQGSAVVREVWIEPADLDSDRSRYRLRFANEAAEPIAIRSAVPQAEPRVMPVAADGELPYLDPVPSAEIFSFGVGVVTIDAGMPPPDGGGFEVRRSDAGWGPGGAANLVGRFTTQQFTVARTTRFAEFCIRAYDAATPPRYSRLSAILHLDYPV